MEDAAEGHGRRSRAVKGDNRDGRLARRPSDRGIERAGIACGLDDHISVPLGRRALAAEHLLEAQATSHVSSARRRLDEANAPRDAGEEPRSEQPDDAAAEDDDIVAEL